jgi:hypothetical protein
MNPRSPHPQRVESFKPHDPSPPGIHERRPTESTDRMARSKKGAYERQFGSYALFGPAAPTKLSAGDESFGQLVAGAVEEAVSGWGASHRRS